MKYVIDTNIFLRVLINENEKVFQDCVNLIKMIKKNQIQAVMPGIVLSEVVWTLGSYYKFPKKEVLKAVESILNLSGLEVFDEYDYRASLQLYRKKNVKYIDTCICTFPELITKKWTIISYDKDFDQLGVVRKQPEEVMI